MVTDLITVAPEDEVFQGIHLLLHHHITGAPVVGNDRRYLGMLSEKSCMSVLYLTAIGGGGQEHPLRARDFMDTKLLTLHPETDAFEAISTLLKHRVSGASVLDEDQSFLGVFSERYIMRLLINSAYDQMPSPRVGAFMNTDRGRLITPETDLLEVSKMFLEQYYRRLPVLSAGKLVGQVSRRDVLGAEHHLARFVKGRRKNLLDHRREPIMAEIWHGSGDLPSTEISHFMDTSAETIAEDLDCLAIARIFLNTNRRRLPVLREGKLVGQISRRDLLVEMLNLLTQGPHHDQPGLYLSAVADPEENPILRAADPRSAGKSPRRLEPSRQP